jgi:hypothetical protein
MNKESILQKSRILLGDMSSVKFSDTQLETALAQVVEQVNVKVPHVLTEEFVDSMVENFLMLPDTEPFRNVLSLLCMDYEPPLSVAFYFEAGSPAQLIVVDELPDTQMQWRVKGVVSHRIEGLDGADFSTIPNYCEMLLASGTAAYALQMRNTQLSESVNQEAVHYQALQQNMNMFEKQFQTLLSAWQSGQPSIEPVLPDGKGWPVD